MAQLNTKRELIFTAFYFEFCFDRGFDLRLIIKAQRNSPYLFKRNFQLWVTLILTSLAQKVGNETIKIFKCFEM